MLPQNLAPTEVRVLGALVEKELSTPDHYPLSLNALVAACNQSSNRDPVMSLDNVAVMNALDVLRRQSLVRSFQGSGERVPKFQHLLDLARGELAVLCWFLLRGPQTLAEVTTRSSRLEPNESVEALQRVLEGPAVTRLARRPGQKEQRYAHLLGGEVTYEAKEVAVEAHDATATDRIAALEEITQELRNEVSDLRSQLDAFRKQFE